MPTTIPEWLRPGPGFMMPVKIGNPYKIYGDDGDMKHICIKSDTILYISLFLHISIIALSIFAIVWHERKHSPRSKTNPLRYAPQLTE